MKKIASTILFVLGSIIAANGQTPKSEKINETDVPKAVKDAYQNNVGFPVEEWRKLTLSNGPRFVAVTKQMNPASGKTLLYRYRYNTEGKVTSSSQYRGTGKGEGADFFSSYLSTDDGIPDFKKKVDRLVQENEVVSFEAFDFIPGNQDQFITTHRFVLKDKKGKISVLYFDHAGKDVDMTKYPIRKMEAEEMD